LDTCNGYFAGYNAIYKTIDEGVSWEIDIEDDRDTLSMDVKPNKILITGWKRWVIVEKGIK